MLYEVVETRPVAKDSAVISDQIVRLSSKRARQAGAYDIRRVEYRDSESGKVYVFITNQRNWSAQTVADLYKSRWEVELFLQVDRKRPRISIFRPRARTSTLSPVIEHRRKSCRRKPRVSHERIIGGHMSKPGDRACNRRRPIARPMP
jgi:putative transposase